MKNLGLTFIASLISVTCYATVGTINGTTSMCTGLHETLSDSTSGGVWSSSNTAIATVGTTGRVLGVTAGTATITYTVGIDYATTLVTVEPLPKVYTVTGGGSVCAGGPGVSVGVSLTDINISYQVSIYDTSGYRLLGGGILGTGAPMILGYFIAAGTYYVTADDYYTGCPSDMSGSVEITVKPIPAPITGPVTVCEGDSITLEDTTTGGTWSSRMPAIATVNYTTGVVTGISGSSTYISYTASGCSRVDTISVDPISLPIVTYDSSTNTFYATPGFDSYQWYNTSGLIPGATSPTLAAVSTDYYYVVVSNSNGCERASAFSYFNVDQLSVNTISNNDVSIYPNPASNVLIIRSSNKISRVLINNLLGQTVYSNAYNTSQVQVSVANLPQGVYFVKINDTVLRQFVKQ